MIPRVLVRVLYPGYHGSPVTTQNFDLIGSLQWETAEEPYTLYQEMAPPLRAEGEGPPIENELISLTNHAITSPPYDQAWVDGAVT
jgi:dethiobiotin synthetase